MQKSVKDMTEQEKRLLRLDLIMKQTDIMAGDFANTQESLANQLRIAGAEFTNVQAAIGKALVPAVEKLMTKIGPLLEKIIEWIKENPELAKWITIIAVGIGALLIPLGALLLILPGLAAGFALVSGAMLPITAVVVALAAAIAIGIVIWKNWETMGMKLKIVFAILFPPIVALIAIIKNWNTIIDKITLAFIFTKKVILDLMIVYNKVQLAVAKFTGASKEQQDALKQTILELELSKVASDEWADNVRANAQKRIEATEEEAKVAAQAGEKTEDAQKSVIVKTLEKTGVMQDSSEKVQVAAQEETTAIEQASQKQIDAAVELMRVDNDLKQQRVDNFLAQRRASAEAATKMREDIDGLVASLDPTLLRWQEFGGSHTKIMQDIAMATGDSIEEIGAQWKIDEVNINSHEALLEAFHKRMGMSWFDYSNEVKAANERIAEATKILGQELKGVFESLPAMSQSAIDSMEEDLAIIEQKATAAAKTATGSLNALTDKQITNLAASGQITHQQARDILEHRKATAAFDTPQTSTTRTGDLASLEGAAMQAKLGEFAEQTERTIKSQGIRRTPVINTAQLGRTIQQNIDKGWSVEKASAYGEHLKAIGYAERASGGPAGGLTLVGERGPELVSLPGGSFVHRSGSGPGGQTNNFIFNGSVYGVEDLKDVVIEAVRDHAISGGFSGVFEEA